MTSRLNKTSICSVVFLDIAGYSNRSISEQIDEKNLFNKMVGDAVKTIVVSERIILDTGDGAAITLTGEPEEALFVSLAIRNAILEHNKTSQAPLMVRIGINLGSVRVVSDINGQLNVIGDAINVAQRIMSFAEPNQILVSRSYFEVASRLTKDFTNMFSYFGIKQDKHVREHEVYQINAGINELDAKDGLKLGEVITNTWTKLDESDTAAPIHIDTSKASAAVQTKQTNKQPYIWLILPALLTAMVLIFYNTPKSQQAPTQLPELMLQPTTSLSVEQAKQLQDKELHESAAPPDATTEAMGAVITETLADQKSVAKKLAKKAKEKEAEKMETTTEAVVLTKPAEPTSQASLANHQAVIHHEPKAENQHKIKNTVPEKVCSQAEIALNQCRK